MKRKSTTPVAPSQRPRRSVQNQVSANTPSKSMPNTRKSYAKKEIVTSEIAHAEDIQDKSNDKPIDPENNASKSNIGRSIKPNNNNNNNSKDKSSGSPTRRNRRSLKRKQIVESEDSNDNCESGGDETEGNLSESDDTSYTNEIRKPNKRAKPKRKSGRRIVSESEESEEMYDLTEDDDEELSRSKTIAMSSERPKRQRKSRVNLEQSEEEVLEEITDTPKPQTRRRGRPKKTQLNETEISDEISSTRDSSTKTSTPKTRPGRSKINDEEKGSEKKKRGRKSTTKVVEEDLENPGEDDDPDSSVGNDMVICQVCQQEMTSKVFMKKHKKLHHDLCWTQHQEPIDIYNPQLVLDILGAKRKQLQVATGRRYQIALSFECFFCKLVKKSELGYYSHLLVCHRSDEEIEKANKQCDKCEKTIFLPHYHAHQLKHIKEEAVEQEPVVEKRSTSPGPDGKRSAACRAASKITNITKNLLDVETTEGKRKKNEDMEFEIEDDAEEEEDDCSGNSDNESGQENDNISEEEKYLKKEPTSSDNEENYTFDSDFSIGASAGSHTISSAYSPVLDLQHSYEMQKSIYSSVPLYEELQVPRFEFLEESIAKKYLPVTKKSMVIKYPQRTKHFQLNLFSSEVVGDRCVLFCGGPVWTMDWCPHLFSQARSDEYLAIAAQPDINKIHEKNIAQSYKSVIQIWKFPRMSCLERDDISKPQMIFGIAHEEGAVWNLKWCPSGGVIQNKRTGLLAAACSSGKILLYAVPWLGDIDDTNRISLMNPVLILQMDENNETPCYNIAWQPSSPHNLLYAGYGDGYVAVFNIQDHADSMLQVEHNVILSINLFQAHLTEICLLSLCTCKDVNVMLTCGNDRMTKLWDLTDFTSPIQMQCPALQKKSVSGGFAPHLPIFITGSDCTYFNDASALGTYPVRDFAYIKDRRARFHFQTSAHFTLSSSAYSCSIISGSEEGHVYFHHYGKGLFMRKNKKEMTTSIFHTKLVQKKNDVCDADDSKETKSNNPTDEITSTYEHAFGKYILDYVSRPHLKEKKILNEECDVANVISSCWNNNANNFKFATVGQKCGLVHMIYVQEPLSQHQVTKFHNYLKSTVTD